MQPNLLNVLIGILCGSILIPMFLPKKYLFLIREFFLFLLGKILKYKFVFIGLNVFLTILSIPFGGGVYLVNFLLIFYILFREFYKIFNYNSNSFFLIMPSFVVHSDELKMDRNTKEVNYILKNYIDKNIHKYWLFRNNPKFIHFVNIPNFFPMFFSEESYFSYINKVASKNNGLAIVFYKGEFSNGFSLEFFIKENLMKNFNTLNLKSVCYSISQLKKTEVDKIELSLSFMVFMLSQSFLDIMISNKDYKVVYEILNEMTVFLDKVETVGDLSNIEEVNVFVKSWKAVVLRYYSFVSYDRGDYKNSAKYLFKAQKESPIFPRTNYQEAKDYYINFYLKSIYEEQLKIVEDDQDQKRLIEAISSVSNKNNNENYYSNLDLLIKLLSVEDDDVISYIGNELDLLIDSQEVFNLLFVADAYKYFPNGEDKFNEIYLSNVGKSIFILEKILEIDPSFDFLYVRLVVLYLINIEGESINNNEKINIVLEKAKPIYHKYGFI